jgi:hypothetical protein
MARHRPSTAQMLDGAAACEPCFAVVRLIMDVNDPELCDALRCIVGRATLHSNGVFSIGFLTVKQVAEKLQTSAAWVRRHADKLRVTRIGEGRGADLALLSTGSRRLPPGALTSLKPRRAGSVYQRGRVWWVKYYDRTGRARRESSSSEDKSKAEHLLRSRLGDVASGKRLIGADLERTTFEHLEQMIRDAIVLRSAVRLIAWKLR